jgi:hypothetical protein
VSPARLTYLPTGWTPASRIVVEFATQGPGARPHTPVSTCARFGLQQAQTPPKNLRPPLSMLFRGLTCYTEVGSNGRDAPYQTQTGCQTCDLEARDTHARADDGLQAPMLPKVSPARFDIFSTGWTTRIQGSSNFVRGPKDQVHPPTHRFQRARKIRPSSQTPPKFAATSLHVPI